MNLEYDEPVSSFAFNFNMCLYTMDDVTADRPAFETSFNRGMAADLGVSEADMGIGEIAAVARRRRRGRGLLAAGSGVSVDFSVDNAADAATATALAAKVSGAAASSTSNLAKVGPCRLTPTLAFSS